MTDANQDAASEMLRQLSTHELHAMLAGAATELAQRWIAQTPGAGAYLQAHWGMSVEVVLAPKPEMHISFIDNDREKEGDGTRYRHATIPFDGA